MRPTLSHDQFEPLASRIAEVSGIRVPASKRWLLAGRVADRMGALGRDDVERYVRDVLDPDGAAELGQLVEAVRVGETRFYRHAGQLRAIRRVALPEIRARREREGDRLVRVWSAGCATGEEAYTLAMLLEDALPASAGWRHEVLATDMSDRALDGARRGRYPKGSAHAVPAQVARWAIAEDGDEVVVTQRARAPVRFERRNLLDASYPRDFDLVLCRNVLIYFDRATQREVLERLERSVLPGGYLALGYAERLDRSDGSLLPIRTEDGVVYRRSLPDEERAAPTLGAAAPPAGRAAVKGPTNPEPPGPKDPPRAHPAGRAGDRPDGRPGADRASPVFPAVLSGTLEGPSGEATARRVLGRVIETDPPMVDLRRLQFADEGVARVLAQAAAALEAQGRALIVLADGPGTLRFLRRHGIAPPAEARTSEETA